MNARKTLLNTVICLSLWASAANAQSNELPQYSNGTAFFITQDGYLLTANHVVQNCGGKPYISGRFIIDGNRLVAPEARLGDEANAVEMTIGVKVIATNETHDLALIKIIPKLMIENYTNFRSLDEPLRVGETAIAVGYPFTSIEKMRLLDFETQKGTVIAIQAPGAQVNTFMTSDNGKTLGTHGYSGGPVLDGNGNVIGVNLAVSCLNKTCIEAIRQFKTAYGDDPTKSSVSPEIYQERLETFLDSSTNSDLAAIENFTRKSGVTITDGANDRRSLGEKIIASSHAIANIGCTAKTDIEKLKTMKLGER